MAPRPRTSALITAVLALVATLLLPAATGAIEQNPRRAILVYAGADEPRVVAAFKRVSCEIGRVAGKKQFKAIARSGGWKLDARINDFDGYRAYDVGYGIGQANFRVSPPGGGSAYSNINEPEQAPPFGGKMTTGRKRFGLGFFNAFNGDMNDAVGIAGLARCR